MYVKKTLFVIGLLLMMFTIGCSNINIEKPTTLLDDYIKKWEETDFTTMYDMLTDEAKETYNQEGFIDRYEKIYGDLEVKDVSITYEELDNKTIRNAKKDREVTIPVQVKMESIAGKIEFTSDVTLRLPEEEKDKDESPTWLVQWDPGLIYPGMENNGNISISTVYPKRGEIIDQNQMPLALNDLAYEIGVVPNQFGDEEAEKEEIARLLNISVASIDNVLDADWVQPEHFIPLRTIPTTDEETLNQLTLLPAGETRDSSGRNYPSSEASAHLTGYVGKITSEELENAPEGIYKENDMIGKAGLEKLYEEQLRGEKGVKVVMTTSDDDVKEEVVLAEKPVKNGEHVQVSIDVNIQELIYNTFKEKNVSGTAAAVHPTTGEVLALVSSPSYDPNELTYGITQDRWDSLMDDPQQPFLNRFTSTYAPGSVIKPITAAIGLTEGSITHDEGLTINGLKWGKESWNNVKVTRVSTSNNPVNLRDALVYSDNIYFAQKSLDIGHDKFVEGLKGFGFDTQIPISFPFTASQISNSGDLNDEILLANSSYGQGEVEMSSLHLALSYTALLNGGDVVKPSFLKDDPKGEVWLEGLISPEDADIMQEYLREVVTDGTAKVVQDDDLEISGKTGTAELKLSLDSTGQQNGWFVGYPTEDPDILIAMMMEATEGLGTSGFVAENVKNILIEIE